MTQRPTQAAPSILQIITLFYVFFIPLFLLSHVVSWLSPEIWLAAIKTVIVIWCFGYMLRILIELISIPLRKVYETETYWVYRHVSYPRWVIYLNTLYRCCMAVRGWILFTGGMTGAAWFVYLYVMSGLEIDLFIVILAHWTALLASLASTEEWSAGGEFLLDNWHSFLKGLAVVLLALTY